MMPDSATRIMCPWLFGLGRFFLWSLLITVPLQPAAAPAPEEYKIKAALIYKLSKFVAWPEPHVTTEPIGFGICVLGENTFGSALDSLATRKTGGQPIHIKLYTQSESIGSDCRMVFISQSKRPFLRAILKNFQDRPILTLGDTSGFAETGGIIEFTRGQKRIGFKINLKSAEQAGLKIAAPLLELATVIDSAQGKSEK